MPHFDVLVVGSGIAGLSFARKLAEAGFSVAILTKKNKADSNTNWAQGGISAVMGETDDFESHVRDTLIAGDGLCREDAVREIVSGGPACIDELVHAGVAFDHEKDGKPALTREGGHSHRRILHVADITGKAIEEALLGAIARTGRVSLLEHVCAIDLITRRRLVRQGRAAPGGGDRVLGLYALDTTTRRVETFTARAVMLATGGVGQVYQFTTNPDIATGDGIAMAWRAGVEIQNMEFVQFHPTALYSPSSDRRFLITEAVRGEGAILRNLSGEAFMKRYDPRGDLAPRDIVARAIDSEMKKSGTPHVWLDIRHEPEAKLKARFPAVFAACEAAGINISRDMIPVVPAAHYLCGGVRTKLDASTALPGLYACGEVACTGLHGANRLASNSLLEAVVVASKASAAVISYLGGHPTEEVNAPDWVEGEVSDSDERVVLSHNWDELRRLMWDYVGIVRTTKRLERARARILFLRKEINDYYWNFRLDPRLLELRNLVDIADLIVRSALERRESRGLHFTLDYPQKHLVAQDTTVRREEE